ncbi:MAG TPA: hypothetical protein VNT79_14215 [Phycisphaerae bacterium]|nr:hypothetical protein [Phycisphaerae bacterium]
MTRKQIMIPSVICLLLAVAPASFAQPEPSLTGVAWQLQLEPSAPVRIVVDTGTGQRIYWYMLYTVINNSSQDVDFHPEIVRVSEIHSEVPEDRAAEMADEAARFIVDASKVGIHPKVFQAIKSLHAKTHPFLVEPYKAIGKLRQGKDNALTSVAIFPELDLRASRFTVYFGGLSGEQETKKNPSYDPKKPNSATNEPVFVLRKTLAIPYTLPGDFASRKRAEPQLGRMEWVMR